MNRQTRWDDTAQRAHGRVLARVCREAGARVKFNAAL